jgi:peptidoglycan/xylan/chitin deacetylase (PgdA/CDA1 family)
MARVTLTFDNGPHPEGTPLVLDTLRRHELTATFFVLGKRLAAPGGAELARGVLDAGHRLGNHTFSHEVPLGLDPRPDAVEVELERTAALIAALGEEARLFRPFGGQGRVGPHLLSPASVRWLREREYTCVLWNSVPGDFRDPEGWVETALADVATRSHSVVVLHDLYPEAMRHLGRFLEMLADRGHQVVDDFPADCVPLLRGEPRASLDALVQDPTAGATSG